MPIGNTHSEEKDMSKIDFWDDIRRVCKLDDKGRVIVSRNDEIICGEIAQRNINKWFRTFGLIQMPKTFVELVANWNYCVRLDRELTKLSELNSEERENALNEIGSKEPEFRTILETKLLCKERNESATEALAKIHKAANTFEKNTRTDVYTLDLCITEK